MLKTKTGASALAALQCEEFECECEEFECECEEFEYEEFECECEEALPCGVTTELFYN